jgi:hypothetical protein
MPLKSKTKKKSGKIIERAERRASTNSPLPVKGEEGKLTKKRSLSKNKTQQLAKEKKEKRLSKEVAAPGKKRLLSRRRQEDEKQGNSSKAGSQPRNIKRKGKAQPG